MRFRQIAAVLSIVLLAGAGAVTARGTSYVGLDKQWTIVSFPNAVLVKGRFVMGPVLIVHDTVKMGQGEACTTFYRFDPARGPREEIVSFHCQPKDGNVVKTTTLQIQGEPGCARLVEYQIGGDFEVHGVPQK